MSNVYEYVKFPEFVPALHCADGEIGVAANEPIEPADDASAASTVAPEEPAEADSTNAARTTEPPSFEAAFVAPDAAGSSTFAVTFPVRASTDESTGVRFWHSAFSGVSSAHAGNCTSRARSAQVPAPTRAATSTVTCTGRPDFAAGAAAGAAFSRLTTGPASPAARAFDSSTSATFTDGSSAGSAPPFAAPRSVR
ncbi:hypothetical protein AB0K43_04400 [Kitasatospora sp. NPDC049258]|uniref:hypothetical protein n=1 Tax=Kitasatospora sp. NPDC049258 TaxID=3155394 RepID=UPI0034317614